MRASDGLTVVELLVTLAIAAILGGLALASWSHAAAQWQSTAAINQLIGMVAATRHAAVVRRTVATVCPSGDGVNCGARDSWNRGAIIFEDSNQDGRRTGNEMLIAAVPGLPAGSTVYWRSFRNRASLSFGPRGWTRWQNGHFLYCAPTNDARLARQAIINAAGRARLARDRDGDGVAEDASGRPLSCPP